jgi:hypothetical protein
VATVGAVVGFSLNSLTYAISAAMLFLLVVPRAAGSGTALPTTAGARTPAKNSSFGAELLEGFSYVRSQPALLYTIISSLVANFFIAFYFQYVVIYVSVALHGSASLYGVASGLSAIGFGVGAVLAGRFRLVRWTGWVYILSWGIGGLSVAALGIWASSPLLLVVSLGFAICGGLGNTCYFACVQRIVPGHLLGRFFAIDEVTSFAIIPLGQIFGGIAILYLGVLHTELIAGLGASFSILALLASRSARNLSDRGVAGTSEAPPAVHDPSRPSTDGPSLAATFLAPA